MLKRMRGGEGKVKRKLKKEICNPRKGEKGQETKARETK